MPLDLVPEVRFLIELNKKFDYFDLIPQLELEYRQRFEFEFGPLKNWNGVNDTLVCFKGKLGPEYYDYKHGELTEEEVDYVLADREDYVRFMKIKDDLLEKLKEHTVKAYWYFKIQTY